MQELLNLSNHVEEGGGLTIIANHAVFFPY
jgi:hypothetical protein